MFAASDPNQKAGRAWFRNNTERIVTTDYVVNELLTLLRSRHQPQRALNAGKYLWESRHAQLHYLSEDDLAEAWNVFRRYNDKEWSFTDCTSYVVMKRMGIRKAFAFDRHFRQFDGITVVP